VCSRSPVGSGYTACVLPDASVVLLACVLGALIGSFSNVLIYRLPRRESIAFPPSRCPNCGHRLGVLDLVPMLSWLALRGRCRYCRHPIRGRYPLVEFLTAAGYGTLAFLFPWSQVGVSLLGLCAFFTVLLVSSFIDAETFTIPDELTLPAAALGLLLGYVNERSGAALVSLPTLREAFVGMLLGAGILALIGLYGAWVMRRFREREYPDFPVNYQQLALAAVVGAWFGVAWGVVAGLVSVGVNVAARRVVRVPEFVTLAGLLVTIVLGVYGIGPSVILMVQNGVAAAGGMGLLAGLYWWTQPEPGDDADIAYDPEAMGFGDVKLAAVIGAFLGWELFLVSVALAVVIGAVVGVIQVALGRGNKVPFGPYLALGALGALLVGDQLIQAYQGMLGLQ